MVQPLWKTVQQSPKKFDVNLSYDTVIPFSGIYSRKMKTYVHTKTCTQVFITALLFITKQWKQSKHPPTDECINRMSYIYTTNTVWK